MCSGTRLFVGNLPYGVKNLKEGLTKEFSHYGEVKDVELKIKKDVDGNEMGHFAFVTLQASHFNVNQCIEEFSQQEWNGAFLNVSVAKESFLERLKREREESDKKNSKEGQNNMPTNHTHIEAINIKIPERKTIHDYEERKEIYAKKSKIPERKIIHDYEERDEIYVKKSKQTHTSSFCNDVVEDSTNNESVPTERKEPKRPKRPKNRVKNIPNEESTSGTQEAKTLTPADEKRLKSMQEMRSAYNEKKSLIKMALSSVDKKVNKIVFDDDGLQVETRNNNETEKRKSNQDGFELPKTKKMKARLFDDEDLQPDDEADNFNFDFKERFQGKEGQKLMQLQSRYHSDKRFVLDERFIDNNDDVSATEVSHSVNGNHVDKEESADMDVDGVQADEKRKEIEILESILGTSVKTSHRIKDDLDGKKQVPIKTMLRYDPTRADHDKFTRKPLDKSEAATSKKSKKEKKELETKTEEQKPVPEVSQERYYTVNQSLKRAIEDEDKKPFSLLSMFGKANTEDDESNTKNNDDAYEAISLNNIEKVKNPLKDSNPFKYESDTDDEKEGKANARDKSEPKESPAAILVKENFFILPGDPRLEEGLKFFLNSKPANERSREELKHLVKKRIKNNMRNERSHQTKMQQGRGVKRTSQANKRSSARPFNKFKRR